MYLLSNVYMPGYEHPCYALVWKKTLLVTPYLLIFFYSSTWQAFQWLKQLPVRSKQVDLFNDVFWQCFIEKVWQADVSVKTFRRMLGTVFIAQTETRSLEITALSKCPYVHCLPSKIWPQNQSIRPVWESNFTCIRPNPNPNPKMQNESKNFFSELCDI